MSNLIDELAGLLRRAAEAHHDAFTATDGDDPDWPLWYADYLKDDLRAALGVNLAPHQVADLLIQAEEAFRAQPPGGDWPEFYAQFLAEQR